jgi:hypothetical protein
VQELIKSYVEREQELEEKLEELTQRFENYKEESSKEINLKDILMDRQKAYTDLLVKELTYAKNIIKNPNLF